MRPKTTDAEMIGRRFGKLEVLNREADAADTNADWWTCRCDCGNTGVKSGANLRAGRINSCGCGRQRPEGRHRHPLYPIWNGMMTRCYNTKHKDFPRWGGTGVFVAAPWHDFWTFVTDMSPRPPGKQIERRNGKGPYSKKNCYWATASEQARNRHNNRRLTIDGVTRLVIEWSEISGIPYPTILARYDKWKLTAKDAVFKPLNGPRISHRRS